MFVLFRVVNLLTEILAEIRKLRRQLNFRIAGLVSAKMTQERGANGMAKFAITLPAAKSDVVLRLVAYAINGVPQNTFELPGQPLETPEFEANEGDIVSGELADTDDADNVASKAFDGLVLRDTIAPTIEGEIGVRMVTE